MSVLHSRPCIGCLVVPTIRDTHHLNGIAVTRKVGTEIAERQITNDDC